jgi:hypothetical protein
VKLKASALAGHRAPEQRNGQNARTQKCKYSFPSDLDPAATSAELDHFETLGFAVICIAPSARKLTAIFRLNTCLRQSNGTLLIAWDIRRFHLIRSLQAGKGYAGKDFFRAAAECDWPGNRFNFGGRAASRNTPRYYRSPSLPRRSPRQPQGARRGCGIGSDSGRRSPRR